ncbi:RNA-directed DNA polymerase from mobile element jockey [Portunus trituberculatus]|uniref:RNA-directed DNA polymerase from mobile element jockey n=1 Tax=Portunus trituberculatus TaxID=210409 RepID=A0A5B7FB11_PORTR|nr:RNA-directed DNA polymerase from mobile element jockey [Portunus trituberculatus]
MSSSFRSNATVTLPGFAAFHWPRADRAGGGLTIFARRWLDCRPLRQPLHIGDGVDVQAVTIHLSNRRLTLYNIYRPTTADLQLDELFGLAASEFVLAAGDFNAHQPWLGSPRPSNTAGRALYSSFNDSGEVILLNDTSVPTHLRQGRLDLTFVSSHLAPTPAWSLHPTLTSDHFAILIDVDASLPPVPPLPLRFNMRCANWGQFTHAADSLLTEVNFHIPLDEHALLLSSLILQAAHSAIPVAKVHSRTYKDAWIYGPKVKELNRRLNAARKNFHRRPTQSNRLYLNSVAHHVNATKQRLRDEAWLSWCRSIGAQTPIGQMWRRARCLYNPRPPPMPTHANPHEEAERLATQFAARTSPAILPLPIRRELAQQTAMRLDLVTAACEEAAETDTPFILHELAEALRHRTDTSPGSDRVRYSMLSHLGPVGKRELLTLINASYQAGALPRSWKTAIITPIPKPGASSSMRPISLLSCISKVMEKLVLRRLQWQAGEFHSHLFAYQHQRSTTTCLLTLLHALRSCSGLVVFLDLVKAFELADPPTILETLTRKGVKGRLICWIHDFLTERAAKVRYQGHVSAAHAHTLGTPQGSCLCPFLFNSLIERLLDTCYGPRSHLLVYADDLALFLPKRRIHVTAPKALETLYHRCNSLGLKLNPAKTCYMSFGLQPFSQPLTINGAPIRHVTTHRYLGVYFDSRLTFTRHVAHVADRTKARPAIPRRRRIWRFPVCPPELLHCCHKISYRLLCALPPWFL